MSWKCFASRLVTFLDGLWTISSIKPVFPLTILASAVLFPTWLLGIDCNRNGMDDAADIQSGQRLDCNANSVPDECDLLSAKKLLVEGPREPVSLASADMNGDGSLDLVAATEEWPNHLFVFLQSGDGSFTTKEVLLDEIPWGMTPGDFDSDGDVDVALPVSGGFLLLRNTGDGERFVAEQNPYPASYQQISGDFDGDGDLDIAVTPGRVLLNRGDGSFVIPEDPVEDSPGSRFLASGDFDGDHTLDLLTEELAYSNKGDGTFRDPVPHGIQFCCQGGGQGVVGDFNGDAFPDLVVAAGIFEPTNSLFLNNGHGKFSKALDLPGLSSVAGDFDGDSDLDLVTGSLVLLNDGDGSAFRPLDVPYFGFPRLAADLDGDAAEELVCTYGPELRVVQFPLVIDTARCLGNWVAAFVEQCPPARLGPDDSWDYLIETDKYSLEIESASGAVGDVV